MNSTSESGEGAKIKEKGKDSHEKNPKVTPRHIQNRDGQKFIIIDQMNGKTRFIYENFYGSDTRKGNDG